jgi:hypothetical protein
MACVALASFASIAGAGITYRWSGSPAQPGGSPVSLQADLSISGDTLTVVLANTTPSRSGVSGSTVRADLLSSFYFDIGNGSGRPTLSSFGASGDVWHVHNKAGDVDMGSESISYSNTGRGGWVFESWRDWGSEGPLSGMFGFGLGTVGNNGSSVIPRDSVWNFPGNRVGGLDYSIYGSGEVNTNKTSLNDLLLVQGMATFTFRGISGWTEADVGQVAFGLGAGPDRFETVVVHSPLPGSVLLGVFAVGLAARKLRKFAY